MRSYASTPAPGGGACAAAAYVAAGRAAPQVSRVAAAAGISTDDAQSQAREIFAATSSGNLPNGRRLRRRRRPLPITGETGTPFPRLRGRFRAEHASRTRRRLPLLSEGEAHRWGEPPGRCVEERSRC